MRAPLFSLFLQKKISGAVAVGRRIARFLQPKNSGTTARSFAVFPRCK
jgi:hypothetical protein